MSGEPLTESLGQQAVWDRLPKVKLIFKDGEFDDYEMPARPGRKPQKGHRSSKIGKVAWDKPWCRDAFVAYACLMDVPDVFRVTHGYPYGNSPMEQEATRSFQSIQNEAKYMVGGASTEEECQEFIDRIIKWANSRPQLFERYFRELEVAGDPKAFVFHG